MPDSDFDAVSVLRSLDGRCLFGPIRAIRLAVDLHDNRPVHDSVQERHRQRWIAPVVAPRVEVDVRHQRRRPSAAGVDQLVQQARCLGRFDPFQSVERTFRTSARDYPRISFRAKSGGVAVMPARHPHPQAERLDRGVKRRLPACQLERGCPRRDPHQSSTVGPPIGPGEPRPAGGHTITD
jgi:hypothetical protein